MTLSVLGSSATLRVFTRSDWHVGSGEGAPGGVNARVRLDADKLPYVPGTTLTGVYRESCIQVARGLDGGSNGAWWRWARYLFGHRLSDGADTEPAPAVLRVRSAHVSAALRAQLTSHSSLRLATTFVKPGVALDHVSGRAEDHHIRFAEMARAGVVLTAPVELDAPLTSEQRTAATVLLVLGAAWLRALGGDRRRGSGAVDVSLTHQDSPQWTDWVADCATWADTHEPADPPVPVRTGHALTFTQAAPVVRDDMVEIPLRFTTVDAVRCPRTTLGNVVMGHDHLPGTTVLAWLLRTLDGPQPLRRALATGNAVVTRAVPDLGGEPAIPMPAALGRRKHDDTPVLRNRLWPAQTDLHSPRESWMRVEHDQVQALELTKHLVTHNVVTEDSGRPTTADGGVFTVEVIPSGRTLHGVLRLAPAVLAELDHTLGTSWETQLAGTARMGAASKSEYGRVRVEIGDRRLVGMQSLPGTEFTVMALSDVLVRDSRLRMTGQVADVVNALAVRLGVQLKCDKLGVQLKCDKAVGGASRTESWHSSWRLPRPSLVGLAAGSCLRVRVTEGTIDPGRFHDLLATGLGERRGEGFGQLAVDLAPLARPEVVLLTGVDTDGPPQVTPAGDELVAEDVTYLDVVRQAALHSSLARRITDIDAVARAELRRELGELSRSQRGAVRELVTGLGAPDADQRLKAFLAWRAKGKFSALVKVLGKRAPVDALVTTVAAELGIIEPTQAARLAGLGLFVLDVLTELDAQRTPRTPRASSGERPVEPVSEKPSPPIRQQGGHGTGSEPDVPVRPVYRPVHTRWELTATLVARTPLHVGGAHNDPYLDLTVARDGHGSPYVPGTSLAGVLRDWWRRRCPEGRAKKVWDGTVRTVRRKGVPDEPLASLVTVADAPLRNRDGTTMPSLVIRDGVGIDRYTGSAAYRVKYEREVIPAGALLRLHLIVEDVEPHSPLGDELQTLKEDLREHGLLLGAATTRGLGRLMAVPDSIQLHGDAIGGRTGVLDAIRRGLEPLPDMKFTTPIVAMRPRPDVLRVTLGWRPDGPLLVGANLEGERAALMPLVDTHPDTGDPVPVLPGSSVKGVLRSEVERSLRTLLLAPDSAPTSDFVASLRDMADRCPPFAALFGSQDLRAALSIPDIFATLPDKALSWDRWRAYEAGGTDVTGPPVPGWQESSHVAVDRWSGAAADGMLFTVLEPHGLTWQPLTLDIEVRRLGEDPRAALTLLLYALAALAAGTVPLGHGGNRGLGAVRVEHLTLSLLEHGVIGDWTGRTITLDANPMAARAEVLALARELWGDDLAGWTARLRAPSEGATR